MSRHLFTSAAAAVLLVACGGNDTAPTEAISAAPAKDAAQELAVYAMDCGTIEISDLDVFAMDGSFAGQSETFSDACFLIRHPEGDLLWDLGLPAALVGQAPQSDGPFTTSLEASIVDQLATLDLTPADIDYVAVSHYHFDHTGQPEAAGNAKWLVHEAEKEAMFSGQLDEDYSGFTEFETITFDGDYDVFGDSRVHILHLPGHTPGHTALLVDLGEDKGRVMLSGDMYHRIESRSGAKIPRFNTDPDQTLDSMDRFEALAEASEAQVIIQHSMEHFSALPKIPDPIK